MYYDEDSTYYRSLSPIAKAVNKGRVIAQGGLPRLFFLCGANGHDGNISYRRKQVSDFIHQQIKNSHIIIAEQFFDEYIKNQAHNKKNSLDFEHILSEISEKIIIIMESPSAVCELGAFAHERLRKKLIVINDKNFIDSPSFINTGPIQAVKDSCGSGNIIWYPMENNSPLDTDGIASTFIEINNLLHNSPTHYKSIDSNQIDPSQKISITSILFIHDLIFMMNEVNYKGLIYALKKIFGENKDYSNTGKILTLLISLQFIDYPESFSNIKSKRHQSFFKYTDHDITSRKGFLLNNLKKKMRA